MSSRVPAADLLNSPELSSASSQESEFVTREKDEEEPCETESCSTRKPLFNNNTPRIQFTCVVTPSKSVSRYSTHSKLETSRKAERLCQPIDQHTEGEALKSVIRRSIFDDSLDDNDEAVDDTLAHSACVVEFQQQHRREVSRLEEKCSTWEEKMGLLQQKVEEKEEDSAHYEEGGSMDIVYCRTSSLHVLLFLLQLLSWVEPLTLLSMYSPFSFLPSAVDLVRMTVCMTRLLVKEKLKQFSNLCLRAKVSSG